MRWGIVSALLVVAGCAEQPRKHATELVALPPPPPEPAPPPPAESAVEEPQGERVAVPPPRPLGVARVFAGDELKKMKDTTTVDLDSTIEGDGCWCFPVPELYKATQIRSLDCGDCSDVHVKGTYKCVGLDEKGRTHAGVWLCKENLRKRPRSDDPQNQL
jgi:hypothetical protein